MPLLILLFVIWRLAVLGGVARRARGSRACLQFAAAAIRRALGWLGYPRDRPHPDAIRGAELGRLLDAVLPALLWLHPEGQDILSTAGLRRLPLSCNSSLLPDLAGRGRLRLYQLGLTPAMGQGRIVGYLAFVLVSLWSSPC